MAPSFTNLWLNWDPANPQDPEAWERFWRDVILPGDPEGVPDEEKTVWPLRTWGPGKHFQYLGLMATVIDLRRMGAHRALVPGNGISFMPYVLAHLGLEATAVDFSQTATEYCRTHPPSASLRAFFGLMVVADDGSVSFNVSGDHTDEAAEDAESQTAMDRLYWPGGSVEFGCADILEMPLEAGSYDIAVLQRNLSYFRYEDRKRLFARLHQALRPSGAVLVQDTDLRSVHPYLLPEWWNDLEQAGFVVHSRDAEEWWTQALASGDPSDQARDEYRRRWWTAHERDSRRLRNGERMAFLFSNLPWCVISERPEPS